MAQRTSTICGWTTWARTCSSTSSGGADWRPVARSGTGRAFRGWFATPAWWVAARDRRSSEYVGIARALTDFAYCCYVSDLAVDRRYQRRGIGTALLAHIRIHAGPEALCLLVSAPQARSFYEAIGMRAVEGAFLFDRER
ncbi:MAG: GNAT family N-acetyltransferase [Sphingomonas sp.]